MEGVNVLEKVKKMSSIFDTGIISKEQSVTLGLEYNFWKYRFGIFVFKTDFQKLRFDETGQKFHYEKQILVSLRSFFSINLFYSTWVFFHLLQLQASILKKRRGPWLVSTKNHSFFAKVLFPCRF